MRRRACLLCAFPLLSTLLVWASLAAPADSQAEARTQTGRGPVYLLGSLSDEDLMQVTTAVARRPGLVLQASAKTRPYLREFLQAWQPESIQPIGPVPEGLPVLPEHTQSSPALSWSHEPPAALWNAIFPTAGNLVVCSAQPRSQLLQAACLAGVLEAPLFVLHGRAGEFGDLQTWLDHWQPRKVYAVGPAAGACRDLAGDRLIGLASEDQAAELAWTLATQRSGPMHTLVITNPADASPGKRSLSTLAPWLAIQKHAALITTNPAGTNVATLVEQALHHPALAQVDTVILLADLHAIPMERRPNPVPGKDAVIEMEPLTSPDTQPESFAVGRLFHEDPAVLSLLLARERLWNDGPADRRGRPRKAMIVSNPGGGLALLETFSRSTAQELTNRGYQTTALFDEQVQPEKVRRAMPEQDLFLWEGHYRTMVDQFGLPNWNEPLQPSLVFLQSCLALNEKEVQPLFQRGAVAVMGSSTRTFSGSGGAFSLAFFDALLYDGQSLGGGLRQAKNFLRSYAALKQQVLGDKAKLAGANVRSAWAFSLWGDPTLQLPLPALPDRALPAVRPSVEGSVIRFQLPSATYSRVRSGKYEVERWPNTRLAGLISHDPNVDESRLVPFLFAEVPLSAAPAGKSPYLSTRLAPKYWVFSYDRQRKVGYLLVMTRPRMESELRFRVHWD